MTNQFVNGGMGWGFPNPHVEPLGGPVSDPTAPLGVTPPAAPNALRDALVASQGMVPTAGIPAPPEMPLNELGMAKIWQGLGSWSGNQANNPMMLDHNQRLQNYQLQLERMRALKQRKADNPYYAFEEAINRGYFEVGENESMAQAYRRFTQEQFKDPTKTALQRNSELYQELGYDADTATKIADGQYVLQESDGVSRLVDKTSGEVVQDVVTEAQAATIKRQNANRAAEGTQTAQGVEKRFQELMDIDSGLMQYDQSMDLVENWVDRIANDEIETGLISGFVANTLGIGDEVQGEALGDAIEQALLNLQITNLAPVTEREIAMIKKMFIDISNNKEINRGALNSALKRIQRAMEQAEYKANQNIRYIREFGSGDQRDYIDRFYPETTDNIEEL